MSVHKGVKNVQNSVVDAPYENVESANVREYPKMRISDLILDKRSGLIESCVSISFILWCSTIRKLLLGLSNYKETTGMCAIVAKPK